MNLGKVAYEGYISQTGGKSLVSGATLPPWVDLPENIQAAWNKAADAVRSEIQKPPSQIDANKPNN